MIERLNQLPLSAFIDLSCGDNKVLLAPNEQVDDESINERASQLIIRYKSTVNPSGIKALLSEREEATKENAMILLLRICQILLSLNCYDEVREILALIPLDAKTISDEQVKAKVEERIRYTLFQQKRNNQRRSEERKEAPTPEQIRSAFYSEIAFMMTYFKMNIDLNQTNAAVYANIVHQADVDIRMKLTRNR